MTDLQSYITFSQLLSSCSRIEIPLIQRDYAQGREAEKEVRDEFLRALKAALLLPAGHPNSPLNLDFVYGNVTNGDGGNFLPLDGQQRLTTLFLLHWYLAWRDGQHVRFKGMLWDGRHSRFVYRVRPSSTEFFDELVCYDPGVKPEDVSSLKALIEDQSWFFLHWRLDPTIQSALEMLEAIHFSFKTAVGLFSRIIDDERPAITFQLLPLQHFGLTDDLYIKMNARGKPLTPFETFKARFEELLEDLFSTEKRELSGAKVSVREFFERRIDTKWTDFFWAHKNSDTHTFDDLVMNILLAVARVSLNPASDRFAQDITLLRSAQTGKTFSLFHEHGWLTRQFADNLISLLEAWSRGSGKLDPVLPSARYFDEVAFFQKIAQEPTALDYTQLVQFAAFVFYLRQHESGLQPLQLNEWMRVVRNLATNTEIERPEEYGRSLEGLRKLLPHSSRILEYLAHTEVGQIGFSPQQVREEVLKARLILDNDSWRGRITRAEEHEYFSGQIGFLLDFSGVQTRPGETPVKWDRTVHTDLQAAFDDYLKKAQITFGSSGLALIVSNAGPHLWQRALLTVGDYLLTNGSNSSFLTDRHSNWDSWKRFMRDGGNGKRKYMKALWDGIDSGAAIDAQLGHIIRTASNLEPWRAAVVRHPEVISYCGQQEIRRELDSEEIYLLEKRQMNGTHAELFSYVLYLELSTGEYDQYLTPFELQPYQSVYMTALEPHVLLTFRRFAHVVRLIVESERGQFRVYLNVEELRELPEVTLAFCENAKFALEGERITRLVPRNDIYVVLEQAAKNVSRLPL